MTRGTGYRIINSVYTARFMVENGNENDLNMTIGLKLIKKGIGNKCWCCLYMPADTCVLVLIGTDLNTPFFSTNTLPRVFFTKISLKLLFKKKEKNNTVNRGWKLISSANSMQNIQNLVYLLKL